MVTAGRSAFSTRAVPANSNRAAKGTMNELVIERHPCIDAGFLLTYSTRGQRPARGKAHIFEALRALGKVSFPIRYRFRPRPVFVFFSGGPSSGPGPGSFGRSWPR